MSGGKPLLVPMSFSKYQQSEQPVIHFIPGFLVHISKEAERHGGKTPSLEVKKHISCPNSATDGCVILEKFLNFSGYSLFKLNLDVKAQGGLKETHRFLIKLRFYITYQLYEIKSPR